MVQEYFVERVRDVQRLADERRAALHSKSDAEAYVRDVRAKIQQCFGPWPEKTPLNPRITGVVERDSYKIEKVIFDSRPDFPVTANLYLPKGGALPRPGVVGSCGHSTNGKAEKAYQSFAQGLARLGYVCLIYDPIGQGERLQYANEQFQSRRGSGVSEHLYAGNQQFLVGEFFGAWRAWDGIRALDYLLTRPEVDAKQVGITGNSGGGTMTTWLCGVEPRWAMAAPSCFVTTFLRNLENELPADTEQCPPRVLALGLDHSDFIAAMAPKPAVLLTKEKDFFDTRGTEEAYGRLQQFYRLLGAEENISLFRGPTYHGYTQENREAMYRWFNHVTKISDAQTEPALTMENDETLWCTPHGQVAELKPRTVFSFTREHSQELKQKRVALEGDALKNVVRETLRLPARQGVPEYRILRPSSARRYPKKFSATYAVETEPGIFALVYRLDDGSLLSRPPRGAKRALLYVAHQSADAELRTEPLIPQLIAAEPESAVFACDVRGIGESQPDTCGANSFLTPYGSDYFYAIHSIMLDRPYAGQKTHDVLRVLDWLRANGHEEIHLVGKGWGAIPAAFGALLGDGVQQVTLKNALTSYSDVAESEEYRWPLSCFVPGVLAKFDLPDCYRALAAKQLRQVEPWGALAAGG
ncbi:prolyl oligopeptidase family serine peptidase [Chthoniobacter sp.]|uniref:alpha/beta hydrolase family protein n=1 Tax=Chthoniobacter sp. TaxID=2510640 RepID=UPI0032AF1C2F